MDMRILSLLVFGLMLASGCITAPVGFYETAFPSDKRWSAGVSYEWARNYGGIPYDTAEWWKREEPREMANLAWICVSPVPKISLGIEAPYLMPEGHIYAGTRAKAVLLNNDVMAAAIVCRGGGGLGEETDGWVPYGESTPDTTRYKLFTLGGAGILSYNLLSLSGKETSTATPRLVLSAGPKTIFTYLDYRRAVYYIGDTDTVQDIHRFQGYVNDFGWFGGIRGEVRAFQSFLGIALEMSYLSVESPLISERKWTRFWGGSIVIRF